MFKEPETIFAIGHSTLKIAKFMNILKAHSITLLVDIRRIPKSRHNPQFNKEFLKKRLYAKKTKYLHLKDLGGLRTPAKDSINKGWRNDSFRGYADYMQTKDFANALKKLIELGKKEKLVIMCAEGNPFRCHRSLVADALVVRKIRVYHISSQTSIREHELTKFAVVKGKRITYP